MSDLIATMVRPLQRGRRVALLAGLAMGLGGAGLPPLAVAQSRVELPDFTELVEKVGPSVVNIRTMERSGRAAASPGGGGIDPNMEEFFRRFGIPLPGGRGAPRGGGQGEDEPQQRGVGSGFILSADGFVMTNAHVVDGADELMVTLTDKREFKAKVIGLDKRTDVAVVKIEATGLPAVTVLSRPKGEPMAITHSPTFRRFTSPIFTGARPVASIFTTATSERRSAPTMRALNSRLSVSVTMTSSAPSTTWALVMMKPSAVSTKPEPTPRCCGSSSWLRGLPRRSGWLGRGMPKRRKNSSMFGSMKPPGRSALVRRSVVRMLTTEGPTRSARSVKSGS